MHRGRRSQHGDVLLELAGNGVAPLRHGGITLSCRATGRLDNEHHQSGLTLGTCGSDAEARAFAQALARKRVRAAFPDDFTAMVKTLLSRMVDKHGKDSPEGRALRALIEIRILASPEWEGTSVEVMFWFIREEDLPSFEGKGWDEFVGAWLAPVHPVGRFTKVFGEVTTLARMTAEDYVNSDRLDPDHLSSGK